MDGYWAWGVPAGLLAAGLYALGRIGKRENVAQWGHGLTNRIDGLVRVFVRRFHRFQYDPIPYPKNGGALLASNHVSGLDPMLLTSACTRPLRFMVATEQFHRFGLEWLYRRMGAIPVDRDGAPEKGFYDAREALQRGELIAVFPQGRISADPDAPVPLKRGVILLADLAKVPIIPVRVSGIAGAGKVISAVFMRSNARLVAGPPIWVKNGQDKEALARLSAFLLNAKPSPILEDQSVS